MALLKAMTPEERKKYEDLLRDKIKEDTVHAKVENAKK
jgi:hypothetical protein